MVTATATRRRNPLAFGRRMPVGAVAAAPQPSTLADDLRLFGIFFLGGLTFMSVYLA